ncbi:DUF6300 family protein [Saccharopolyspora gloriosae]|uniref:DUF6300 family protein n=1 Tax=Saccharopolyspora gloriosae TaxID=455344 RepID=UPI001FB81FE3|nr:DUF6300 family protein [Saccharopolyspora gloriosae]
MTNEPDVELAPRHPCVRCGTPILAAVTVPISDTEHSAGRRITATVCPTCDRHHPAPEVQGVIAYFTLNERITGDEIEGAGQVLSDWAQYVTTHPPTYTSTDLDDEIEAWERGEM